MKIRVPATSANLGCGFDSCGIALSKYLSLEIKEITKEWLVEHDIGSDIPTDETNLVVQTALELCPDLQPRHLVMQTEIPPARGLGSSSTAIVAGIELANRLGNLNMTPLEKVKVATKMETHPDNVAPAILGDFVVSSYYDGEVSSVKHHFPDCDVVVYIPKEELLTSESREVLPETMDYKEAVTANSISNVMIAALLNGDLALAGSMMEKDMWHERYRANLVPHMKAIKEIGKELNIYASVLSGAGPTILNLCAKEVTNQLVNKLEALPFNGKVEVLSIDTEGTQVF